MTDYEFDHVNQEPVYTRMIKIRDTLGDLYADGVSSGTILDSVAADLGRLFEGDMRLFRFMDEKPGSFLVNGRGPFGEGGPGRYFDGKGREGWHILLRQLRNGSDAFWDAFWEKSESAVS